MIAPFTPMLAELYDGENPEGWWVSEKLDGVRALWDGSQLWTRHGNIINAPSWFLVQLPAGQPLDGELYGGRGNFNRVVSILNQTDAGELWRKVGFHAFDIPGAGTAEERIEKLSRLPANEALEIVEHTICTGHEHLAWMLESVRVKGGEGLMLREPGSAYEPRRTFSLLKLKSSIPKEVV